MRLAREGAWLAIAVLFVFVGLEKVLDPEGVAFLNGWVRGSLWIVGGLSIALGLMRNLRNVEAFGHVLAIAGLLIHLGFVSIGVGSFRGELLTTVFGMASAARICYLVKGELRLKIEP